MCDKDVPSGGLVEVAENGSRPLEGGLLLGIMFILAVADDPRYGHAALW